MHLRRLHHLWTIFRRIRPWYFFAAAAICLAFGITGLRNNNLQMAKLRDAVYKADQETAPGRGALPTLHRSVRSHRNPALSGGSQNAVYPPIQLKHTYERLQEAEAK